MANRSPSRYRTLTSSVITSSLLKHLSVDPRTALEAFHEEAPGS